MAPINSEKTKSTSTTTTTTTTSRRPLTLKLQSDFIRRNKEKEKSTMASGAVTTATAGQTGGGNTAWNQLDQLLTCAICLDRYRNPKLLPCQHTFCMEPCLEGLIDYVRRQIKCPECRAEHRIPYNGIQGYPTNVTLMRFLELHFEMTGEELPLPTVMERCGVCSEKSYVTHCAHCEKKVCGECKEAHLDIVKREISRINNQVRRGLNRLQEALEQAEKSSCTLQTNCTRIIDEISDICTRLQKSVKDREDTLKTQVQEFLKTEIKNATNMKDDLEVEISNIQSNCELVEQHVTEASEWEDVELVDYKDIFLKTLEFLRNFDPDASDFNRRLKFSMGNDPDAVHRSVANFGELTMNAHPFAGGGVVPLGGSSSSGNVMGSGGGQGGGGGMLMRSKSDHRLASQFQESNRSSSSSYLGLSNRYNSGHNSDNESRDGRSSPISRRRAGDYDSGSRRERNRGDADDYSSTSRRYGDARGSWQRDDGDSGNYRSRFSRDLGEIHRDNSDTDVHGYTSRSVRFAKSEEPTPRERVFETEDATRGPLSGIARLLDSPRVMQRLQQNEQKQKQKEIKAKEPPPPTIVPAVPSPQVPRRATRQVSEDDEIAKQKAQNKAKEKEQAKANTTTTTTTATTTPTSPPPPPESPTRPLARRVAALQREESGTTRSTQGSEESRGRGTRTEDTATTPANRPPSREGSGESFESAQSRPSSRQSSDVKDSGKSTGEQQGETKEEGQKKRLNSSSQGSGKSTVQGVGTGSGKGTTAETAVARSGSDSDSEAKTSQDSSGSGKTPTPKATVEDISGQEKPNYFKYRTANYSRTPSNSSVNLNSPDSQDESGRSGARSPSSPQQSPPFSRGSKTTTVANDVADTKGSDSSSSSGSSDSSSSYESSSPVRTKKDDDKKPDVPSAVASRLTSGRGSGAGIEKENETKSPSTGRNPTLANIGRSVSADKKDEVKPSSRFQSRFLPRTSSLREQDDVDKNDSDSSSSSESDSDDNKANINRANAGSPRSAGNKDLDSGAINAILTRSALARKENAAITNRERTDNRYGRSGLYGREKEDNSTTVGRRGLYGRDETRKEPEAEGRYSSLGSRYLSRSKGALHDDDDYGSRYGTSSYTSRLARSKSSATVGYDRDDSTGDRTSTDRYGSTKKDTSSTSRYGSSSGTGSSSTTASIRSRLARSRSDHRLDDPRLSDEDDDETTGSTYRSSSSRFERPSDYSIGRSKSHHTLNSREQSPEESSSSAVGGSTWARYLRNKYGGRNKDKETSSSATPSTTSTTSTTTSTGRLLGRSRTTGNLHSREPSPESSDDERGGSHDSGSRRNSTVSHSSGYTGLNSKMGDSPRSAYFQKRRLLMKIGNRGSEQGCFTWPRGIAVGPDNTIVVADSSNHRVQVFDATGSFTKEFGCYGSAEGEFDCLAGVAVNRIGQYIVSDRYNHRIQVFDPSGRFLRAFGSAGGGDGRLSYPWGIATDSLGFIYCCDKENHRVQVFQSDGTFVGKFGSLGTKTGQLEHPHYIAVSNTNKVIVSDSNNHRVQIFDVNGRVLSTFGSEGSDDGQFKFPRGVAVDDQGYIIVGDSGNNRIQIFNPDGTFLKAFGTWGSGDAEFKGLEGVAVSSNGNILVCDRENHRIQVF